ncbi:GNAT family N-acetyltransferase [Henriciella sp.]|uniref:GNAT family N-acetyltransferase n=1 Tax=Henriciella sp. TaxID=1968823 RepID=UPI002614D0D7|nr:GNAT family N-acetyltransferase [Henriciella sp.]
MTEIRTERFLMRPPVIDDAAAIADIISDRRIYENVASIEPSQGMEKTGRWILNAERGAQLGTDHVFLVVEEGVVIATAAAHRRATSEPFEIGYWVAPAHWGRGVATEAARALVTWLEARGQAAKLVSGHFKDNPASGRVLEKLGFIVTHEAPVYCVGRGCDVDHIFMVRKAGTE